MNAELTLLNAKAFIGNTFRKCNIRIGDGRILSVTNVKTKKAFSSESSLDLSGCIVLPGMVDCHTHFFTYALAKTMVDLSHTSSITEMQDAVRGYLKSEIWRNGESSRNRWVIGLGWDQERFKEKRFPSRKDLDKIEKRVPLILVRVCGHVAVINSAGFTALRLLERFDQRLVERDGRGKPKGLVKEAALVYCWWLIGYPRKEVLKGLFLEAQKRALATGLVAAHCILSEKWRTELSLLRSLDNEKRLLLKFSLFLPISSLSAVEKMAKEERSRKLNGRNFVTLGFKLFADGSLGARTAALAEPYSDNHKNTGILYYGANEIASFAARIKELGMTLAIHAIGDRAILVVLESLRSKGIHLRDNFRIEHCSVTNAEIEKQLGDFIVSVQPSFATSDHWVHKRLGEKRRCYAFSTLNTKAGLLVAGSDSPVENLNPFVGIHSAMTSPNKGESLTLVEALSLYTRNGALASPITKLNGGIRKGSNADLVITDAKDPSVLCESKVKLTLVGGRVAA